MGISIHASRGGSDMAGSTSLVTQCLFQSTLPAREATPRWTGLPPFLHDFNPRFPWGDATDAERVDGYRPYFNPRFPWGKRLCGKSVPYLPHIASWFPRTGIFRFFSSEVSMFFPFGNWGGSHLPNVRHIAASRFFYYTISNGCPSSISMLVHFKSPLKAQKLPEIPKSQARAQGGPVFEVFRKFCFVFDFSAD